MSRLARMMAGAELLANNQLLSDRDDEGVDVVMEDDTTRLSEISIDATVDGKYELPEPSSPTLSTTAELAKQAWAWACWSGERTWDGLDFAGEVVANFLGLTTSKYQWMLDIQEREDEERQLRRLEARQRRQLRLEQLLEQEKRKLDELETGYDDNQDDLDITCENNQKEVGS